MRLPLAAALLASAATDETVNRAEYLTEAWLAHKPDLLVLHGVADLDGDGVREIAMPGRMAGEDALGQAGAVWTIRRLRPRSGRRGQAAAALP